LYIFCDVCAEKEEEEIQENGKTCIFSVVRDKIVCLICNKGWQWQENTIFAIITKFYKKIQFGVVDVKLR
jgi:hypothetical protein